MFREYERRFLLDHLPPAEPTGATMIRQVYWDLGRGWSLRLRREGPPGEPSQDTFAIKGPREGPGRPEYEIPLPADLDDERAIRVVADDVAKLYRAGSAHQVVKRRLSYVLDDQAWDIDEFDWDNAGLIIAELEKDDVEELVVVPTPSWCVKEITGDARYNNENLAYRPYRLWR